MGYTIRTKVVYGVERDPFSTIQELANLFDGVEVSEDPEENADSMMDILNSCEEGAPIKGFENVQLIYLGRGSETMVLGVVIGTFSYKPSSRRGIFDLPEVTEENKADLRVALQQHGIVGEPQLLMIQSESP